MPYDIKELLRRCFNNNNNCDLFKILIRHYFVKAPRELSVVHEGKIHMNNLCGKAENPLAILNLPAHPPSELYVISWK